MEKRRVTLVLPVLACLLAGVIHSREALAQPLTNPLTAEEVACNERQLARLLDRLTVGDPIVEYDQIPKTVLVTYSNSHGFYEGLALTNQDWRLSPFGVPPFPPPPEHYLAFNLNPSLRSLLLNPERPMLGQVSLNREQSSSNFVAPRGYFDIAVKLDPALTGAPSANPLEINNFEIPAVDEPYNGFLANSTKPGRGLDQDGLLTACHNLFTPFDLHVFSILERIFRASTSSYTIFIVLDLKIAIFRGEQPNVYRINIYPIDAYGPEISNPVPSGRVALEAELFWTPEGRLVSATLRGLPVCGDNQILGCTLSQAATTSFLIVPVLGGSEDRQSPEVAITYDPANLPTFYPQSITVDLEKLLLGSTWNRGAPSPP